MAGKVRNDDMSSLPPDYVSLVQLRDIWMKKKQEEKKQKEKEEEERKQAEEKRKQEEEELRKQEEEKRKQEAELRKQEAAKRNGGRGYARVVVRERVKKTAFVDEKGKGKEVIVGGYGNVEGNNKGRFRRPKSRGDERNRNEEEKEKFSNGKEMVAINGVRGGMEFRGGFRNNGRSRNDRLKGESDFGGGMSDDKGYNEKRGERGRNNGGYLNRDNRLKESRDAVLKGNGEKGEDEVVVVLGEGSGLRRSGGNGYKGRNGRYWGNSRFRENRGAVLIGNELEKVAEKKAEGEILESFNEKCCLGEGDRNGTNEDKIEGEGRVGVQSKVGDWVLRVESVKNGEKEGEGKGDRGDGNGKGSFGKRRLGDKHRRYDKRNNKFKERRDAGLMGNELELETEKKADDEILEVVNEKDGNDDKKRNGTNEDRIEGEGSSNNRVAVESKLDDGVLTAESKVDAGGLTMESKVDDGVLAVQSKVDDGVLTIESKVSDGVLTVENNVDDGVLTVQSKVDDGALTVENVKNAEKDGVGKEGYGRHWNKNRRGNFDKRRSGNMYNNRFGNWRGDFGERRSGNMYNNRFGNRRGDLSGMKWVKKEDKSGAAAGTSGVQYIESN